MIIKIINHIFNSAFSCITFYITLLSSSLIFLHKDCSDFSCFFLFLTYCDSDFFPSIEKLTLISILLTLIYPSVGILSGIFS